MRTSCKNRVLWGNVAVLILGIVMKILRVKKTNMYDIFMGDGWKHWTRVRDNQEEVVFIKGNRLNSSDMRTVAIRLALGG